MHRVVILLLVFISSNAQIKSQDSLLCITKEKLQKSYEAMLQGKGALNINEESKNILLNEVDYFSINGHAYSLATILKDLINCDDIMCIKIITYHQKIHSIDYTFLVVNYKNNSFEYYNIYNGESPEYIGKTKERDFLSHITNLMLFEDNWAALNEDYLYILTIKDSEFTDFKATYQVNLSTHLQVLASIAILIKQLNDQTR